MAGKHGSSTTSIRRYLTDHVAISLIDFDVGSLPCIESFYFGYSNFFLFLKRVIFPYSDSIWNMVDEEKSTLRKVLGW